jgi:hypothetical protein
MKLPQQVKEKLLSELGFIIQKMTEEPEILKKIYFYSAVNGALERASRFYFDRELIVAHAITTLSYGTINDRLNHIKMGDTIVPFDENLVKKLIESVSDLKKAIEEDKEVYPAIEKAMEVTYMATGPGFYTRCFLEHVEAQKQS